LPTTYTYQNAIDLVRKFIKDVPLSTSSVDIMLCDRVNSVTFGAYPWRWTLASLTAITLVDGQQDYSLAAADATTAAGGVWQLVRTRVRRTDTTPDEWRELEIRSFLPPELTRTGGLETLKLVSYDEASSKVRLDLAASVPTGVTLQLEGEFKKNPTKIAALSQKPHEVGGTSAFPDQYFDVIVEGLLWKAYQYCDDSRAGSIVYVKGTSQYTGQLGVFHDALMWMARQEDQGYGTDLIFPTEPLGASSYQGGIF
jgi:hypothetical protein